MELEGGPVWQTKNDVRIPGDTGTEFSFAAGIRKVIEDRIDEFLLDDPCHSPDGPHWFYLRAIRMSGDGPERVVISHEEITALKLTEEALRESERQLTQQKTELEEANIALKVLLKQREDDKSDLEQKVIVAFRIDKDFPLIGPGESAE